MWNIKIIKDKSLIVNEILIMCEEIDKKLLEVETIYDEIEDDFDELDSVFLEIEEYNGVVTMISNKKHDEFNIKFFKKVRSLYIKFLELYDDFKLLTSKDFFNHVRSKDKLHFDNVVENCIDKSCWKSNKEKNRKESRNKLRNIWGLFEPEIDLVESGEYEPSQFSEEDFEDDDYYVEDE